MSKKQKIDPDIFGVNKRYKREEYSNARKWFREQIKSLGSKPKGKMSDLRYRGSVSPIGRMCYFAYKAKYDGTLPYWDRTPLVIMLAETSEHFMGLNLHYLPPKLRAVLLGKLIETMNNVNFDKGSYMKVSYNILVAASKYRYFKPCIKLYIKGNIKSRVQVVRPQQWAKAILLPTARFKGASAKKVWSDSISTARG